MKQPIFASVSSRPDKLGLYLSISNVGEDRIDVKIPDPYTGIELFDDNGDQLSSNSLMVWRKSELREFLEPGQSIRASIALAFPVWIGIQGSVIAKCMIWYNCDGQQCTHIAKGRVELTLPTEDEMVRRLRERKRVSRIVVIHENQGDSEKIMDVGRFVSIERLSSTGSKRGEFL